MGLLALNVACSAEKKASDNGQSDPRLEGPQAALVRSEVCEPSISTSAHRQRLEEFREYSRLEQYQRRLAELRQRYTANHPDVIALEQAIAQLREQSDGESVLTDCVEDLQQRLMRSDLAEPLGCIAVERA